MHAYPASVRCSPAVKRVIIACDFTLNRLACHGIALDGPGTCLELSSSIARNPCFSDLQVLDVTLKTWGVRLTHRCPMMHDWR